jgi:putative ABC transport system permease protein
MIRNYLLIALRNLHRQLSYSLINISGLAIGIACSLVMFLYVYTEWSYDRHFSNAERIYKIGVSFFNMGNFAVGPEVLGDVLPEEFEGVEAYTRIKQAAAVPLQIDEVTFPENVFYTDSSFFKVFSYEFILGDARTALQHPASAVVTESVAAKYFGQDNAIGKTILAGKDKLPFTITGIVKDDSRSSQLKVRIWLTNESQLKHEKVWTSASFYSYVLLKENVSLQDLNGALDRIIEKQVYPAGRQSATVTLDEYRNNPLSVRFHVLPLTEVHMKSKLMFEISPTGNETNMYAFAGLSVFILVLASVNFINLTTARASRRAKEVGIRKAIGSSRGKLITQFTFESMLVSLAALVFALALAEVFVSLFQLMTGDRLVTTLWVSAPGIIGMIVFATFVGLVSGIYPALYLTSFKPVRVLKGNLAAGNSGFFRNVLVVFQFTISIALMICSAITFRQMNFMQSKDLGFDGNHVVTIDRASALNQNAEAYKNTLLQMPGVSNASYHAGEPGSKAIITVNVFQTPAMPQGVSISTLTGDHEFVDFMGFRLLKGRTFSRDLASDSAGIILNEAAVRELDLKEPIGAELDQGQHVIGVISDFHWESLRNKIAPLAIALGKPYQLGVRVEADKMAPFLKAAEIEWKKLVPDEPFKYHFLDENFGALLRQERMFSNAIAFFTALAIFISCLGLYGLSAFTAEERTKEIGIRKVLGAAVIDIVNMLNLKFSLLVLTAVVVAVPISFLVMTSWIEGFAYRAELSWWLFGAAVVLAMIIALVTVSFHSLKAALINPADTLKYE